MLILSGGAAAIACAGSFDNPAIVRGAEVAQTRCSACHAVALEVRSPERDAPQFRVLSRLYSAETLAHKLADFSENGHFEMPPVALREDEISDVAAYIESLDGGFADMPPRPRGSPTAVP